MEEWQCHGLFYNCDEKYIPGLKCKHKLFQVKVTFSTQLEEITLKYTLALKIVDDSTSKHVDMEPKVHQEQSVISLLTLSGIVFPQTLKILS